MQNRVGNVDVVLYEAEIFNVVPYESLVAEYTKSPFSL